MKSWNRSRPFLVDRGRAKQKLWPLVNFTNSLRVAFASNILAPKNLQSQTANREKLSKTLLYKKGKHMMLMKLTPWANISNILQAAFTLKDPKSVIRHFWLECIFTLMGSASVKAACKHIGKISPFSLFYKAPFLDDEDICY